MDYNNKIERYNKIKEHYLNSKLGLKEICKLHKTNQHSFSNYLKSIGISTKRKKDFNENIFENIDDCEKAYWLGFLYADGCITYDVDKKKYRLELTLAEKDLNHLQKFKNFLKISTNIKYREKQKAFRLAFGNKKICEDLINLGCTPKKSLKLIFPNKSLLPENYILHFIRGYFDGDGSIGMNKQKLSSVTLIGTKEFLNYIKEIFGGNISKDKRWKDNTFYLRFRINEAQKFLYYIYNNSNLFLDRKYDRYKQFSVCRLQKKFCKLLETKNGECCNADTVLSEVLKRISPV